MVDEKLAPPAVAPPYDSTKQLAWLCANASATGAASAPALPPSSLAAATPPPNAASASSSSSSLLAPTDRPPKWCGCEEPGSQCVQCSFLHLPTTHSSAAMPPPLHAAAETMERSQAADHEAGETTTHSCGGVEMIHGRGQVANSRQQEQEEQEGEEGEVWSSVSVSAGAGLLKAHITMHPLYGQLLAAHVACLRIATPVDQLPRIDAQIQHAPQVIAKYQLLAHKHQQQHDHLPELDQFMAHYVLLLCTFKEQLQQHVRVHAMEAVMACWELEQSLLTLTGVSAGEGTGASMSDDEDMDGVGEETLGSEQQQLSRTSIYDSSSAFDSGAFGPLIPTETERTLMERVRQELKSELKNGYKDRIVDVREEILRKRRAGKLPGDTTSVLKAWWHAHAKWPYPTEDEKARLVQETGLQLKQINNWFINQRKRNWHNNPSSTTSLKTKRKS